MNTGVDPAGVDARVGGGRKKKRKEIKFPSTFLRGATSVPCRGLLVYSGGVPSAAGSKKRATGQGV